MVVGNFCFYVAGYLESISDLQSYTITVDLHIFKYRFDAFDKLVDAEYIADIVTIM